MRSAAAARADSAREAIRREGCVIALCDAAASEACPAFPGKYVRAHWGLPDPAAVQGSEEAELRAFLEALSTIRRRIQRFTSLPFASVAREALAPELRAIGEA